MRMPKVVGAWKGMESYQSIAVCNTDRIETEDKVPSRTSRTQ